MTVMTRFFDLHSGGDAKTPYGTFYVMAPEAEAREFFKRKFGRDPDNVTCPCCGPDFSVDAYSDFSEYDSDFHVFRCTDD